MMKRLLVSLVAIATLVSLTMAGCSQATPAPTSLPAKAPVPAATAAPKAPAAPTAPTAAPAASTSAPAAAPTALPSKKVEFPEKGKTITFIVPWAAGGSVDMHARLLAGPLEKDVGVPIQVVNKPGASSQTGLTELARAKPDGYTMLLATSWAALPTYLDPARKAAYGRKDLQMVANQVEDPHSIAVRPDSPFKDVKELVNAATVNPGKITVGDSGIMSTDHMAILYFGKVTGAKFSLTHFDGVAPATTALLGGHVDVIFGSRSNFQGYVKSGDLRVLGIMDNEESSAFPGVKTLEQQGYKIYFGASRGIVVPAGTPKEIVEILSRAIKRAGEDDEFKSKMVGLGVKITYMDTAEYTAYWDQLEAQARELLALAKQQ